MAATVIGRTRELAALRAFLDSAAVRPMSLALLGDPGIGKSALLGAVAATARERGFRILRLTPDRTCPRGLLRRLFTAQAGPAALPGRLNDVLHGWLDTRRAVAVTDEPALLTAMLLILDRLAGGAPVLMLLDAADHADRESLELLTRLLRHAAGDPVSLLLAARGSEPPAGIGGEVVRYRVRPLADDDAARLLDTLPGRENGRIRQETLHRAAGNPLVLTWLGDPRAALPEEFRRLFDDLPAVTRRLLLHAALADEGEPVSMVTRAGGGSADLRDWAPAEEAGMVTVAGGRIRFAHPLIRECRAAVAGEAETRSVYGDLAAHTDEPYHRARYRAAATGGPDETVAAELEAAADAAERSSDYVAAARALQEAAQHTPGMDEAARRYARAVFAAYRTGEPEWAIALYDRIPGQADPDVRGIAAAGAGLALVHHAQPVRAFELTEAAVRRRPGDAQVGLTVVAVAATAALLSGVTAHRERLPALLDMVGDGHHGGLGEGMIPRSASAVARESVLATADPAAPARPGDGATPAAMSGLAEVARMLFTGTTAWLRDDSAKATAELAAVWRAQLRAGAPGSLVVRLPMLILAKLDCGRWPEAERIIDEAEQLAAVGGIPLLRLVLPPLRAILRVRLGEECGYVPAPEPPAGNAFIAGLQHRAAGLARMAEGDHQAAYAQFRALFDAAGEPLHYVLGPRSLPQLAVAARRAGQAAEAREIVARCCRSAGADPNPRMTMLLSHAAALLDDTDGAEELFRRAIGDPERALRWPLEYAEAQLTFALWLRRRHRIRDSRPHLHAALDTFQRLGARAHAEHARKYLPGGAADADRPEVADAFAELSAQKQQIVRLAAGGLTNREIGQRLSLSPRTVGSHLYDVYPLLGVQSRHQLRELLADVNPASAAAAPDPGGR